MAALLNISVPKKRFGRELYHEIQNDNVFNGAAALAYYLMLAIFPAMIFLLTLLPYLPIENLQQAVMDFLREMMPPEAAATFEGAVSGVVEQRRGGLLSIGFILTLWAASSGLYAVMQQLNITYDVKESRPAWKARGTALLLTVLFAVIVIGAFALIVLGGVLQGFLQGFLSQELGWGQPLLIAFSLLRWAIILFLLLTGFAVTYYFGPDVEQEFRFISPGAVAGTLLFIVGSLLFRFYVSNFGNYSATYGSLGAVIILMLWLYLSGLVLLLGSEINSLAEHYSADGKTKGQKVAPPKNLRGHKTWRWPHLRTIDEIQNAHEGRTRTRPRSAPGWLEKNLDLLLGLGALFLALRRGRKSRGYQGAGFEARNPR